MSNEGRVLGVEERGSERERKEGGEGESTRKEKL